MSLRSMLTLLCAAAPVPGAAPLSAQTALRIAPGAVQERVVSASDAEQQYAIYLPLAYDTAHAWPLAVLMDPRGRALVPLELAREAAERYGYVLISSYNTVSDSTLEPNVAALQAMLRDAAALLAVRPRSIVLVGFSGTARLAWPFAASLPGVTGILGVGASGTVFANSYTARVRRIAFYGVVGTTDFNYDEYTLFRPWLEKLGMPYRIRTFEGPHSWPPAAYFDDAFAWFQLRAARDSAVSMDTALVSRLFARDSVAADSLEQAGRMADASERWREIVEDYSGLRDAAAASARRAALQRDRRTAAQDRARAQHATEFFAFAGELRKWLEHLRDDEPAPSERTVVRALGVDALLRQSRARDPETAAAAARRLEHAFVNLSFYLPRELLAAGSAARALRALDIAERIRSGTPGVPLFRARALVQLGDSAAALDALEEAVRRGLPASVIAADDGFTILAPSPRFRAIVGNDRQAGARGQAS